MRTFIVRASLDSNNVALDENASIWDAHVILNVDAQSSGEAHNKAAEWLGDSYMVYSIDEVKKDAEDVQPPEGSIRSKRWSLLPRTLGMS